MYIPLYAAEKMRIFFRKVDFWAKNEDVKNRLTHLTGV